MNELESRMRRVCEILRNDQVASLFKFPEELVATPCDFMGHTRNGRAILIECKQVRRPSLPLHDSPGLAPHQNIALREASACGAFAIVLWQRHQIITAMRMADVLEASKDRQSLPWAAALEHKVLDLGVAVTKDEADLALSHHLQWMLGYSIVVGRDCSRDPFMPSN